MIAKNQRWAYHDQSLPESGGEGVTRPQSTGGDFLIDLIVDHFGSALGGGGLKEGIGILSIAHHDFLLTLLHI